ncbi:MAG TPA: hypothetical protein PLJ21_10775, partial [Pseudobdellovibrionaceae bacterium]|nr:hypothetical protein [Pseudobdellovibrionaceae bacterium]
AESLYDFLNTTKTNQKLRTIEKNSSLSGIALSPIHEIFPSYLLENLKKGFEKFNQSMKGFIHEKATVYGVESRTSCPLRIARDSESLESVSHKGLYPAGEGAGYAGGITSAACDGVRIAEEIIKKMT